MACPFCKSDKVQSVKNSLGKCWEFCIHCKASGPHMDNADAAKLAFALKNERATLRERIFGKGER
jgi:hypothetical protein